VTSQLMNRRVSSRSYQRESVQVEFLWGIAAILVAGRTCEGRRLSIVDRARGRACKWSSYGELQLSLWPDELVKVVVAEVRSNVGRVFKIDDVRSDVG
jgi:hypothetical protein